MLQGCDPRPFARETGPEQTAKAVGQSYVPVESIAPWETTTPDPPINAVAVEIPRLSTGVLVAADSRCHHSFAKFRSSE